MKKTFDRIGSVAFYVLIVLLVLIAYGSVGNRWYRVISINGNSMSPTLRFGDMVVITPATGELQKNEIISMSVDGVLVTHRIVDVNPDGRPITKGDANKAADDYSMNNLHVVGIYRLRLPGFAYPIIYLSKMLGT